jgi:hypothetical protein
MFRTELQVKARLRHSQGTPLRYSRGAQAFLYNLDAPVPTLS